MTVDLPYSKTENPDSDFDLILEAGRRDKHYWLDLWRYRELFIILAMRDISVRYKQTVLGVGWALIQPVLNMIVMTIIFGKVAGLHSEGSAPYAIMVFVAMLPWMFFSSALTTSSQSMVSNSPLISKVFFPRMIIPASSVVTCFVDFLISLVLLIALMAVYRFAPSWNIFAIPALVLLTFLAALGPGLFITALNVKYRDFRYVIPFLVQFGLYVTPVGFSSSVIREKWGEKVFLLYSLNPMVGVIDGFRWAILGSNSHVDLRSFFISLAVIAASLYVGISYFRKTERGFADII
jgi:lipopolysaccharide transport system permease protein